MEHLRFTFYTVVIAAGLFVSILIFVELGRRLGKRQLAKRGEDAHAGKGSVDSTVYSLLALLIGFTFSGAAARYEARRDLVVEEVGKASTAWQRINALPPESQKRVRTEFGRYIDALIAMHASTAGSAEAWRYRTQVTSAQNALWDHSMAASLTPEGEKARMLLLPALNELFVVVDHEHLAQRLHIPGIIFLMLAVSALASALFAGYGMATATKRNWVYILGFAATISVATCVILELESPRLGLVRVDPIDKALGELRATMK